VGTAQRLREIAQTDRARVQTVRRIAGSALQVHHVLLSRPVNTIARIASETRLSVPTVTSSLQALIELGLVREITGRKRGRVFSYDRYMDVLQQGTEPL
jgi:Fic family protein